MLTSDTVASVGGGERREPDSKSDERDAGHYGFPVRFLAALTRAATHPGRAFAPEHTPTFSMFAVVVLVFGITAVGETLILWHARSPVMREIALVEARHIAERAAVFSGEDRIHEQQARAYNRLIAPSTPGAKTFRVMLAAAALLAALGMTWVALMVLTQFFGGEEPVAPDRPRASIRLVGVAFVPLAVRRLLSGALTLATDPASAANVTTVAEYRELIIARFDLASLAGWNLPGIVERFAVLLTDPFGLWALAVLAVGTAVLLRIPARRALAQTACIAVLWALVDAAVGGRLAILA